MAKKKIEEEIPKPAIQQDGRVGDGEITADNAVAVVGEDTLPKTDGIGDAPLLLSAGDLEPQDDVLGDTNADADEGHQLEGGDPPADTADVENPIPAPESEHNNDDKESAEDGNTAAADDGDVLLEAADAAPAAEELSGAEEGTAGEVLAKPKRQTARKKSTSPAPEAGAEELAEAAVKAPKAAARKKTASSAAAAAPRGRDTSAGVLTIESRAEVETPESKEELVWHEMQNAMRTKRILTGALGGIERMENGNSIAVIYYKDLRVVIPVSEMMIHLVTEGTHYGELAERQSKIINNMLGCEVDFVVKGLDARTHSVVASRQEAMLRKRKTFYMTLDANGMYQVREDRVVQARVVAVASKVVRVEIFGVETSILARDLSWEWIGDAHERYTVGDEILVRIRQVTREALDKITVQADIRSVTENTVRANLKKCRVQGKYAGSVTDIHKGVVFVRLSIGVNAIAHSCYDSRMPAKQDDVSFAVTHLDEDRGVAMGIITRIIKQRV